MQLSAPILPLDPATSKSADGGVPVSPSRGDSNGFDSDFGAMLSAKSRGDSTKSTRPQHNAAAAHRHPRKTSADESRGELSPDARSERAFSKKSTSAETSDLESERELISTTDIVPLPLPDSPPAPNAELDFALVTPPSMADGGTADAAPPFLGEVTNSRESAFLPQASINSMVVSNPAVTSVSESILEFSQGLQADLTASNLSESNSSQTTRPSDSRAAAATAGFTDAMYGEPPAENPLQVLRTRLNAEVAVGVPRDASRSAGSPTQEIEQQSSDVTQSLIPTATVSDATSLGRSASSLFVAEKIAAHLSRVAERISSTSKSYQRLTLTTGVEDVAVPKGTVGINAAKSEALMPFAPSTPTPAQVAFENQSLDSMPLSLGSLIKEGAEAGAGPATQAARRAVEAVLTLADQSVATDQRTVRLQFTVGGEELAVRVELRGERVHTTFRTDSPELRIALAHEWQAVSAGQNGGRTQRLADPVFSSNSSNSGNGMSSDSGAAHQRESSSRQPHATSEAVFGIRRASLNTAPTAAVGPGSSAVTSSNLNPLRLQTFA